MQAIDERIDRGHHDFANIVIAEGARPVDGDMTFVKCDEPGAMEIKLGGSGFTVSSRTQKCRLYY